MSVSRRQLVIGSAFTFATLGATAHAGQLINTDGPGLRIEVEANGAFQIYRGNVAQLGGDGIIASVGAQLTTWTPETPTITGDGSVDSPYRIESLLTNSDAELRITLQYVVGETAVRVSLDVYEFEQRVRIYHLLDRHSNDASVAFWSGEAAAPSSIGILTGATSIALSATTPFDSFHAGEVGIPALHAAAGKELGNELDAAQDTSRSLGVQWDRPTTGGWRTISYRLEFAGAVCGDGLLASAEMCDDGNWVSGDQCTATCTIPRQDDLDDDHVEDSVDLCPGVWDSQSDVDQDGIGDACDPTDDREADLGGSGLPPGAPTVPDTGWGSDDVGPPPTGPNAVPLAGEDATITHDGDDADYGTVTDSAAGCSAAGGGAGGGMLLMLGLTAMLRRRKP